MSPDGNWMWTGSDWIPSPPNSGSEVLEQPNHAGIDETQTQSYHIFSDKNYRYKIAGIFLSILSFFFPFIGSYSPFSLLFSEGSTPSFLVIEPGLPSFFFWFVQVFTGVLFLFLPYMIILITLFVSIKLFSGHEKSPKTAGFVLISLCLVLLMGVVLTSISPNGYKLGDFGLGYYLGLASGILFFMKGEYCRISEV